MSVHSEDNLRANIPSKPNLTPEQSTIYPTHTRVASQIVLAPVVFRKHNTTFVYLLATGHFFYSSYSIIFNIEQSNCFFFFISLYNLKGIFYRPHRRRVAINRLEGKVGKVGSFVFKVTLSSEIKLKKALK